MITVGLDFGTHQTKVCIERKEEMELDYTFLKFEDCYTGLFYTLPSIVGVDENGLLSYGYLPRYYKGRVFRSFKQVAFRPKSNQCQINAIYFSIWYLSFILFDLEVLYGQEFTIQMGVPTDSSKFDESKEIASRIIASAYKLVEEVFVNDKEKFLKTEIKELVKLTNIVPFSEDIKKYYGLLVFPEAYACLKPLVSQGKLETGMNLMIDIGGGTTDISFFTIEDNEPQVYDFYSIDKGLNYLTQDRKKMFCVDSNVKNAKEIKDIYLYHYKNEIGKVCCNLQQKLQEEFKKQCSLDIKKLHKALENRPLVYSGGGSSFKCLCSGYHGYKDIKQISHKEWNIVHVKNIDEIIEVGLCPILSTAYGLAISTQDEYDPIRKKPFEDIFKNFREKDKEDSQIGGGNNAKNKGMFDYGIDYNAVK